MQFSENFDSWLEKTFHTSVWFLLFFLAVCIDLFLFCYSYFCLLWTKAFTHIEFIIVVVVVLLLRGGPVGASPCRFTQTLRVFVCFSVNLDKQTAGGSTALHYCCLTDNSECLKLLLRGKASVSISKNTNWAQGSQLGPSIRTHPILFVQAKIKGHSWFKTAFTNSTGPSALRALRRVRKNPEQGKLRMRRILLPVTDRRDIDVTCTGNNNMTLTND